MIACEATAERSFKKFTRPNGVACVMAIAAMSSIGSTHEIVLYAPVQKKVPGEICSVARPGSRTMQ